MQNTFEAAGVWNALSKQIKAATYTYPGDPLKIDCGYRPNSVVRLFMRAPWRLTGQCEVLDFSYPALTAGVLRMEKAKTDLTAIVEDDQNREGDAIGFALHTLEQSSIHVAPLSTMLELAERARVELKL